MPRRNEVRISPDGEYLAWYRPGCEGDAYPWLVIYQGAFELAWESDARVAGWTVLAHPGALLDEDGHGQPA